MEESVFIISEDYNILFHNRSSYKSYGGNLKGKKCYKILKGREQPCEKICPLRKILLEHIIESVKYEEKMFVPKLNEVRDLENRVTKIDNFNGKNVILEIIEDVTKREKNKRIRIKSSSSGKMVKMLIWHYESFSCIRDYH